jgi:hypothetical protein
MTPAMIPQWAQRSTVTTSTGTPPLHGSQSSRYAGQDPSFVRYAHLLNVGIEDPPAVFEGVGELGPQDTTSSGVAVGDVDTGNLVVSVILEAITAGCEHLGIERRRRITALGQETDRGGGTVIAIVGVGVEDEARVQGIALAMQGVTLILYDEELILGQKGEVIEACMVHIAPIEQP